MTEGISMDPAVCHGKAVIEGTRVLLSGAGCSSCARGLGWSSVVGAARTFVAPVMEDHSRPRLNCIWSLRPSMLLAFPCQWIC